MLPRARPATGEHHGIEAANDQRETYAGPPEDLHIAGHQDWLLFATAGGDPYPYVVSTEGWPQHGSGRGNWPSVYRHIDALHPSELARLGWIRYPGPDWPPLDAALSAELAARARQARQRTAG
jgi:hypothetical protein